MNVGRVMEFGQQLIELDGKFKIGKRLGALPQRIQEIVNAPQELQHQTNALSAVDDLKKSLVELGGALNDSLREFLTETGGDEFFLVGMADVIEHQIRSSGITAAVAKSFVETLANKRGKYMETLKQAQTNLQQLKFQPEGLKPGEAEVGFKIPRALIENKVINLADELEFIDFAMGAFSEAVTGTREEAEVASLGTSDPLIVVKTVVEIAVGVALATRLLIDAYGKYVDILKYKPVMKTLEMPADTLQHLDARADKELDKGIEGIVGRIVKAADGRSNEVRVALRKVLKGMAAKFELGFKVEVRFIPSNKDAMTAEQAAETTRQEAELAALQRETVYPELPKEPLLQLPKRKRRSAKAAGEKKERAAATRRPRRNGRGRGNGEAIANAEAQGDGGDIAEAGAEN